MTPDDPYSILTGDFTQTNILTKFDKIELKFWPTEC